MDVLLIALLSGIGFLVAYHTYGRWLGRRIFQLSAGAVCPSEAINDGQDFVPTPRSVVFGHHFTSIAGTGPIVGPAIAIIWGWLPALIWVLVGSVFVGAVHDLGSLVVSLRNRGQTVGDIAGRLLNARVRLLFLLVLLLALTIVLAVFGIVIASVFRQYPAAIFPCIIQVPLAVAIGLWLRRRGINLLVPSLVALALMYASVLYGDQGVLHVINAAMAGWSTWTWVVVLLGYSYVASVLPVWLLLQPRDYINALQLLSALGLVVLGLLVAAIAGGAPVPTADGGMARPTLELVAPMINWHPTGAPLLVPFLFITVACGAISGFHCLVSSGTSSKQLRRETDAQFVGYGGMVTEGFLAVIVILACAAGLGLGVTLGDGSVLTGDAAWLSRYGEWRTALGPMVAAFVDGSANFLSALGLPRVVGVALMGVMVASFAATTLDTSCRLQRYVIQELATALAERRLSGTRGSETEARGWMATLCRPFRRKHGATLLAVALAALLAAVPPAGQAWTLATAGTGGLILWPLFGATNQLLGGLAFLVISFYLWRRARAVWFVVLPMTFMLIMPAWAMIAQTFVGDAQNPSWLSQGRWTLVSIAIATLVLETWMIIEAVRLFPRARGVMEEAVNVPAAATAAPARGAGVQV